MRTSYTFGAMRRGNVIFWLLQHPWALALLAVILLAVGAFIVWYNIQETKQKEIQRKRDRSDNGSIWDD